MTLVAAGTVTATEVLMPKLSDSMEEGTILSWLAPARSAVSVGQDPLEVQTDKANMTVQAEGEGPLEILVEEAETVAVGTPIARLGEPAAAGATAAEMAPSAPAEAPPAEAGGGQVPVPTPAVERPTRRSTPLARRLAAEHGIALDSIATGSGIGGRVVKADFLADAGIVAPKAAPDTTPAAAPAPAIGDTGAGAAANVETAKGGSSRVGLSRLQTLTARRMAEAKATVPRFQVETEAVLDAARAVDGWAIHG